MYESSQACLCPTDKRCKVEGDFPEVLKAICYQAEGKF